MQNMRHLKTGLYLSKLTEEGLGLGGVGVHVSI